MPKVRLKSLTTCVMIIILLLSAVLTGCSTEAEKEVVAKVSGEEIFQEEVEEYLKLVYLYMPDIEQLYGDGELADAFKQEIVWFLIENRLLDQEISRIGLEIDEAEINKRTQESREELIKSLYQTEEEFASRMKELGLTDDSLTIIFRDAHLRELLYKHVGDEVTEEDARLFVEENPLFLERAPYVHAFHILVETEEEAKEIIQLLEEGGDFMEIGEERSMDNYVELGPISPDDSLDAAFLEAAFALEPGEISPPVETMFGFHIIKITEKEEAVTLTFEDVRDEAMEMRKMEHFDQYFARLMQDTPIETF